MDLQAVRTSYARWAPVYDRTFGAITDVGRRRVVRWINDRPGKVLEVGVGTGLSLPHYRPELEITGIDVSAEMLEKARRKVARRGLNNVAGLIQMDARSLQFPDDHFDTVVAMHVMSVVPEPETVLEEMVRVCKPGGQVLVTNHFARQRGLLSAAERIAAPFADLIGWHADFEMERITRHDALRLLARKQLPPLGMMTFLQFVKIDTGRGAPPG